MSDRDELHLFFRKAIVIVAIVLSLVFLWAVREIVILIFIAGVLAAGISPAVHRVRVLVRHYLKRRIRRGTAVILVYIPFLIVAILFAVFGLPRVFVEGRELARKLPVLLEVNLIQPLSVYLPVEELRAMLTTETRDVRLFPYIRGAVNLVISVVIVLVLIVYIMMDVDRLRNLFLLFYPAAERGRKRKVILRLSRRMSSWLAGQLFLALIVGLATFVALVVLGIPYAVPLALLAAIGEMVPVLGPILGAIPALIIALLQSPQQFWAVLVVAILIQQLENHLLVPRVMGKKVEVSPLAVVIAFLVGGSLLGIVGAVLAIPAAVIIQVAFEEAFLVRRERRRDEGRSGTLVKRERAKP